MTLVVDANVTLTLLGTGKRMDEELGSHLAAPNLLWSELTAVLHRSVWRGDRSVEQGRLLRDRLEDAPIESHGSRDLRAEAWRIADELGWARTYDAEYVALASLLGCRLVTLDGRLRRGADRLGFVVTPDEL